MGQVNTKEVISFQMLYQDYINLMNKAGDLTKIKALSHDIFKKLEEMKKKYAENHQLSKTISKNAEVSAISLQDQLTSRRKVTVQTEEIDFSALSNQLIDKYKTKIVEADRKSDASFIRLKRMKKVELEDGYALKDFTINEKRMDDEFKVLDEITLAKFYTFYGSEKNLLELNQYGDILPYEVNRVVLPDWPEMNKNRYINASYIRVFEYDDFDFIATQSPKESTKIDFWGMCSNERINTIVMLNNFTPNDCIEYIPYVHKDKKAKNYDATYRPKSEKLQDDSIVKRNFRIMIQDKEVEFNHFQYQHWPDQGVPDGKQLNSLDYLAQFIVEEKIKNKKRVLVHCRAGCGRTGTFIAYCAFLEELARRNGDIKNISPFSIVRRLRNERTSMIQNLAQYQLLYKLIQNILDKKNLTSFLKRFE